MRRSATCTSCGRPFLSGCRGPVPTRCPACRPARRDQRSTKDRGYGAEHSRRRRQWKPSVDRLEVFCARCLRLIVPDPQAIGEGWDLGHSDTDRSVWTGPEHVGCNRATAGRQSSPAAQRRFSRVW